MSAKNDPNKKSRPAVVIENETRLVLTPLSASAREVHHLIPNSINKLRTCARIVWDHKLFYELNQKLVVIGHLTKAELRLLLSVVNNISGNYQGVRVM